jgi:hypothetical protein
LPSQDAVSGYAPIFLDSTVWAPGFANRQGSFGWLTSSSPFAAANPTIAFYSITRSVPSPAVHAPAPPPPRTPPRARPPSASARRTPPRPTPDGRVGGKPNTRGGALRDFPTGPSACSYNSPRNAFSKIACSKRLSSASVAACASLRALIFSCTA